MNTRRTIAEISQQLQELYRQQEATGTASGWMDVQRNIETTRAELEQALRSQQESN